MYAYLSVSSWNPHLLAAAGAAENLVFSRLTGVKAETLKKLPGPKQKPLKSLIFLKAPIDIAGQHTEDEGNRREKR